MIAPRIDTARRIRYSDERCTQCGQPIGHAKTRERARICFRCWRESEPVSSLLDDYERWRARAEIIWGVGMAIAFVGTIVALALLVTS